MLITCSKTALEHAIGQVARAARPTPDQRYTAEPTLSAVLLRTGRAAGAGTLELHATNLQIAISATMPAGIRTAGQVAIPARELGQLLKHLPKGSVSIAANDAHVATISQGPHEARLAGIDPELFPLPPHPDEPAFACLGAAGLRHAIAQVLYAASADSTRGCLTAVQLLTQLEHGRLDLYAQDGYRLAATTTRASLTAPAPPMLLLEAAALAELLRVIPAGDPRTAELIIARHAGIPNSLIIRLAGLQLSILLRQGDAPNALQYFDASHRAVARVPRAILATALDILPRGNRDDSVSAGLHFDARGTRSRVALTVQGRIDGEPAGRSTIPLGSAEVDGEDGETEIDRDMLAQTLKTLALCQTVELRTNGSTHALEVRPLGLPGHRHLIMPITRPTKRPGPA